MSESDAPQQNPTYLYVQRPSEVFPHAIRPLSIMAIAQLVIGAVYLYDCPRQPYIPIYLLVTGVITLLPSVLSINNDVFNSLVSLFLFCWFIAGNVWIYSIYEPNYNKNTSVDPYCNKTLYLFAFWTTTLNYIIMGLCLLGVCCILVYSFLSPL